MSPIYRTTLTILGACAVVVLVSACNTSRNHTQTQIDAKTAALKCGECDTIWVRHVDRYGTGDITVVRHEKKEVCKMCDEMARKYLEGDKSGSMTCAACGCDLEKCAAHSTSMKDQTH